MSTPSKSASARKAKGAREWRPEDIAAWMRAQPPHPPHVGRMDRAGQDELHGKLAKLCLEVRHDTNPIPISSEQTPLLP